MPAVPMSTRARRAISRLAASGRRLLEPAEHARWQRDDGDLRRRLDYPLDDASVVVDIGGFKGSWASDVFSRFGSTIHVFEPIPEFADCIEWRFATNPRITLHRIGLAGTDRAASMAVEGDRSGVARTGSHRITIPLRRATDVFAELSIDRIDLLKLNIEGGEYELLDHLFSESWMDRVRHLQVQFHADVPDAEARIAAARQRLAATHELEWRYELMWESWRCR